MIMLAKIHNDDGHDDDDDVGGDGYDDSHVLARLQRGDGPPGDTAPPPPA